MKWTAADTGVVITMAGAGNRFTEAGYSVPKYEIDACGRTLFAWSMESLRSFIDSGSPFIFVTRTHPNVEGFVESQCDELGIRTYRTVRLEAITDGQATTAMLAQPLWDDMSRPLAIYNIDTFVSPLAMPVASIRGHGWLPCFPGDGDKWSFAAADEHGRVSQVREKQRISPHATVGLYWFDSFKRFANAYHRYYADEGHLEAKERYVAPLYNQLLKENADVYIHEIRADEVYPLGTPEDVHQFAAGRRPDMRSFASGQ